MSWSPAVDSSLIHDFEVGLSSTSNGIAPDIFPFRSSKQHSHFRLNHPDVPDGREFYVVIKSIGKSGINGLQVVNISYLVSLSVKKTTKNTTPTVPKSTRKIVVRGQIDNLNR